MAAFVPARGAGLPSFSGLRRADGSVCAAGRGRPSSAAVRAAPSAKLFGWKQREDPNYGKLEGDGVFTLDNLRPAPGSRKRKKRKGRGHAAGQGGACGFGMRGQKSRSGRGTRPGFEGGQTPFYRRIPKFVGRPMGPGHKRTEYALLKIEFLNQCEEGDTVTMKSLQEKGVAYKQKRKLYKVVGGTELLVPNLTVKAHAFTTSAVQAIEGRGGRCVLISPTTGKDLVFEEDEDEEEEDSGQESDVEESVAEDSGASDADEDDVE